MATSEEHIKCGDRIKFYLDSLLFVAFMIDVVKVQGKIIFPPMFNKLLYHNHMWRRGMPR